MSNLTVRILTAVIAGTAVVAGIWFSPWGLFVFCAVLSILGITEFYRITGVKWLPAYLVAWAFAAVVWLWMGVEVFAAGVGYPRGEYNPWLLVAEGLRDLGLMAPLVIWLVMMFSLVMASLFRKNFADPVREIAVWGMGYFYAFLPFVFFFMMHLDQLAPTTIAGDDSQLLSYLQREQLTENLNDNSVWDRFNPDGTLAESVEQPKVLMQPPYRYMALGVLFLIWALDSFAYFGGRLFGKHKLFERISPKKTWEGSLIGSAFCIGLGVLFQFVWPVGWNWIVVAVILSVTGQLGDLVESMFKRSLALQDSGGLLPGHGGILDRFDGFIVSVPFIGLYWMLTQWF